MNLHDLLAHHGIAANPFADEDAQTDPVFQGRCRAIDVKASDGANTGVGLRISGAQREQRLTGTTDWQPCAFEFEVTEGTREVVLVCELRANTGEALFDLGSQQLRRR